MSVDRRPRARRAFALGAGARLAVRFRVPPPALDRVRRRRWVSAGVYVTTRRNGPESRLSVERELTLRASG